MAAVRAAHRRAVSSAFKRTVAPAGRSAVQSADTCTYAARHCAAVDAAKQPAEHHAYRATLRLSVCKTFKHSYVRSNKPAIRCAEQPTLV